MRNFTAARKKAKIDITEGRYTAKLVETDEELDAALRLRFEIFNLELNEGLESSYITGRDEDEFDAACDHLIVVENATGKVVGTYRLLTLEMAGIAERFYCAGEFNINDLPGEMLSSSLEIGRASIDKDYRNSRVLYLLWKGLIAYSRAAGKQYMFGCCSLNSQDAEEGIRAMIAADRAGWYHEYLSITPRNDFICRAADTIVDNGDEYKMPKLFHAYMRFGAKICSPPAIDRQFRTIDFFVIFDIETMNEKCRKILM